MLEACAIEVVRPSKCHEIDESTNLKIASIIVIFIASAIGISSPIILARQFHGSSVYGKTVHLIKCFAAGVILSTSLLHVLPEAFHNLSDCRVTTQFPWTEFPFTGLLTLCGCLVALLVDLTASSHIQGENHLEHEYTPVSRLENGDDDDKGEVAAQLKQRAVSQVLEIGIIFHSVIIGVAMGMSQNVCTMRPLMAALSFHQMFEGVGLGGCIAQAGFEGRTMMYMAMMFSATTPLGIGAGMVVFSLTGYDDGDPKAMIMEGFLGAFSSGILVYMALVDLIAIDFFQSKIIRLPSLKKLSFTAFLLGCFAMSILALWA